MLEMLLEQGVLENLQLIHSFWHIGEDIAFVPNKKTGGIIIGSKIAPIFFNTAQDSGALPIEAYVSYMKTGDIIKIYPYKGIIKKLKKTQIPKN